MIIIFFHLLKVLKLIWKEKEILMKTAMNRCKRKLQSGESITRLNAGPISKNYSTCWMASWLDLGLQLPAVCPRSPLSWKQRSYIKISVRYGAILWIDHLIQRYVNVIYWVRRNLNNIWTFSWTVNVIHEILKLRCYLWMYILNLVYW